MLINKYLIKLKTTSPKKKKKKLKKKKKKKKKKKLKILKKNHKVVEFQQNLKIKAQLSTLSLANY